MGGDVAGLSGENDRKFDRFHSIVHVAEYGEEATYQYRVRKNPTKQ